MPRSLVVNQRNPVPHCDRSIFLPLSRPPAFLLSPSFPLTHAPSCCFFSLSRLRELETPSPWFFFPPCPPVNSLSINELHFSFETGTNSNGAIALESGQKTRCGGAADPSDRSQKAHMPYNAQIRFAFLSRCALLSQSRTSSLILSSSVAHSSPSPFRGTSVTAVACVTCVTLTAQPPVPIPSTN